MTANLETLEQLKGICKLVDVCDGAYGGNSFLPISSIAGENKLFKVSGYSLTTDLETRS